MRLLRLVWIGVVLGGSAAVAGAGEIGDLARDAEAKLQAGQNAAAVEDLRRALVMASRQTPLALRKAIFVSETPQGFDIYKPRPSNTFKPDEPLIVYAEPVGVGWKKEDGGMFHSLLTVDFEVRAPAGEILLGKRDFGKFEFFSREENVEIMNRVTLTLTGSKPGKYIFGLIFHDTTTGKSASVDLPFEIGG